MQAARLQAPRVAPVSASRQVSHTSLNNVAYVCVLAGKLVPGVA